jgi:hypothetical protein
MENNMNTSESNSSPVPDDAVPGIVVKHTLEELPALIMASVARSVQAVIDTGNYLREAKALVGGYSHFGPWCEANLPFSRRTVQRYMAIAEDPVIGELDAEGIATHVSQLPASWGTLYELTLAKDKASLKAAIDSGHIGPGTERSVATEWVAEVNHALTPPKKAGTGHQKAGQDEDPDTTAAWNAAMDTDAALASGLAQAHAPVVDMGGVMKFEDLFKGPPEVWEVVRDAMVKLPPGQRKLLAEWLVSDPGWSALLASFTGPAAGTVEAGGAHGTLADVADAIARLKAPGVKPKTPLSTVLKGNSFASAIPDLARKEWTEKWPDEPAPEGGKQLVLAVLEKKQKLAGDCT